MKRSWLKRKTPLRSRRGVQPSSPTAESAKQQSIKTLKTLAWQAISRYVRARDKRCVTCYNGHADHCGHYQHNSERNMSLGGNALWYDLRNLHGQCVSCNKWRSGNLAAYGLFMVKTYGNGILAEINTLFRTHKKWTRQELLEIIAKYERLLPTVQ